VSVDITRPRSSSASRTNGESGVEPLVYDRYGQARPHVGPFSGGYAPAQPQPLVSRLESASKGSRPAGSSAPACRSHQKREAHCQARRSAFEIQRHRQGHLRGWPRHPGDTDGVAHMQAFLSYVVQAVVSIEASFLLNRYYTWRLRSTAFRPALPRSEARSQDSRTSFPFRLT
jgi:hypothetical protein